MKAIGFGSHCNEAHLRQLASRFGERGESLAVIDGVQLVVASRRRPARRALSHGWPIGAGKESGIGAREPAVQRLIF